MSAPIRPSARPSRALTRLGVAVVAAGAALVALALPASAHVETTATSTAAGSEATVHFELGHGCDGSPTTEVRMQIPDGVTDVQPEDLEGWTTTTTTVGDDVSEVTWTGGPAPADVSLELGLAVVLPDTPGATVYFPTVQTCEVGETAWIQIPAAGGAEPEHPAPGVVLTAADGSRSEGDGAATDAPTGSSDDDQSDTVAIVVVVGLMLAALGGAVVVAARRSRS